MCVDIDATLITAHSDKAVRGRHVQMRLGFHTLLAHLDRGDGTGEALAGMLRPGNAGANTTADHIEIFETAIDQLGALPADRVLVRTDSAGATHDFLDHLAQAGVHLAASGDGLPHHPSPSDR